MSATAIGFLLLGLVDICALTVALNVRSKVVGIIETTGARIESAVKTGIADAAAQLLALVTAVLPDDPRTEQARQLVSALRGPESERPES